eukprot:Sspe_Gene.113167::Locus_97109_Transcript_1_1_Confidence_1.000_Length_1280::g.113167::m.113167
MESYKVALGIFAGMAALFVGTFIVCLVMRKGSAVRRSDDPWLTPHRVSGRRMTMEEAMRVVKKVPLEEVVVVPEGDEGAHRADGCCAPEGVERVVRDEAEGRREIARLAECGEARLATRWRWEQAPFGRPASLGVRVASPSKMAAVVVVAVPHGGAAWRGGLREGDLIYAVHTANGTWPVLRREHMMAAVGAYGHTFEGSTVTFTVVRDAAFTAKFDDALRRHGPFAIIESPCGNPYPQGVSQHTLPVPDPETCHKVAVTMGSRSEETKRLCIQQLQKRAQYFPGGTFDAEYLYNIQSDPDECRRLLYSAFAEHGGNSGKLTHSQMFEVHCDLARKAGVTSLSEERVRKAFEESDEAGVGEVGFDDCFLYLRDMLLEPLYAAEEGSRVHLESTAC